MDFIDAYECVFCRTWVTPFDCPTPTFFDGPGEDATEYCDDTQCVCNECATMHLNFETQDGEGELKPNRIIPECARPTLNTAPNNAAPNYIVTVIVPDDGAIDFQI